MNEAYRRRDAYRRSQQPIAEILEEIREIKRRLRWIRTSPTLAVDDRLGEDGRYWLTEEIGRGGYATVWRALDGRTGSDVAIKVLHPHLANSDEHRERFFRGASQMAGLAHANVVRVLLDKGVDDGYHYFVMEYVPDGDLQRAVNQQAIGRDEAVAAVLQAGDAIAAAHRKKLLHRDIKPSNILLNRTDRSARITDFDLVWHDRTTAATEGPLGTFEYASPEALRGDRTTAASDVFSLAMTALYALASRVPPRELAGNRMALDAFFQCPEPLRDVLAKATDPRPEHRFGTADEFLTAFRRVLPLSLANLGRPSDRVQFYTFLSDYLFVQKSGPEIRSLLQKLNISQSIIGISAAPSILATQVVRSVTASFNSMEPLCDAVEALWPRTFEQYGRWRSEADVSRMSPRGKEPIALPIVHDVLCNMLEAQFDLVVYFLEAEAIDLTDAPRDRRIRQILSWCCEDRDQYRKLCAAVRYVLERTSTIESAHDYFLYPDDARLPVGHGGKVCCYNQLLLGLERLERIIDTPLLRQLVTERSFYRLQDESTALWLDIYNRLQSVEDLDRLFPIWDGVEWSVRRMALAPPPAPPLAYSPGEATSRQRALGVYKALCTLPAGGFMEVLFRLDIPSAALSDEVTPQATRALQAIQFLKEWRMEIGGIERAIEETLSDGIERLIDPAKHAEAPERIIRIAERVRSELSGKEEPPSPIDRAMTGLSELRSALFKLSKELLAEVEFRLDIPADTTGRSGTTRIERLLALAGSEPTIREALADAHARVQASLRTYLRRRPPMTDQDAVKPLADIRAILENLSDDALDDLLQKVEFPLHYVTGKTDSVKGRTFRILQLCESIPSGTDDLARLLIDALGMR